MYPTDFETIDNFQKNFWTLRQIFGLSGEQMAAFLGMNVSSVYNWQNTNRPMKATVYIALRYILENFDRAYPLFTAYIMEVLVDHPKEHADEANRIRRLVSLYYETVGRKSGTEELGRIIRRKIAKDILVMTAPLPESEILEKEAGVA